MQVNDFGALEKLIESANSNIEDNSNLIITLSFFVGLNLLITIIDIAVQFKIKNKEKDINHHNLRESKRIDAQEKLYNLLEELTYYDNNNSQIYQIKSSDINKFITQKKIFLNKQIISIAQEFNDYFLTVLADYRKKNYSKEMDLLDKYSKIFNNE